MNRVSSVVEVNGNRYDAASGQLIGSVKKSAQHLKSSATGVVDGFIRQSSAPSRHRKTKTDTPKKPAQSVHKKVERSRTLMRSGVSRPAGKSPGAQTHKVPAAATFHEPAQTHKKSLLARATKQHRHVNRFGHVSNTSHTSTNSSAVRTNKTIAALSTPTSTAAAPTSSQIERLLDQALLASHQKPRKSPGSFGLIDRIRFMPRWLSLGAAVVVLGFISAFLAWQNVPQVAIKVASTRAGVNASIPSYAPEGYSFSAPLSYKKGEVLVRYQKEAGAGYEISQQASKMDSSSLASTVLAAESNVQTSQVKGTTIYIYGDNSTATWVNNGVKYTLTGQAGLDSNQILKIAGSL